MTKKNLLHSYKILGWGVWASLLNHDVQQIFYSRGGRWAYIVIFSFLLSWLLTPLVRNVAKRFSVLDQPADRKMHKKATPLLGGVAIFVAFTTSLLMNNILDWGMMAILFAGALVMLVSVVDDIRSLSAQLKLVVQLAAASIVYFSGVEITILPTHGVTELTSLLSQAGNFILTFLWIVGITNAMNFLDGTDGLASGLGVVISLFLGIVAFQTNQVSLGWAAIAMLGSCLGFIPYNFRVKGPATIFLGDAGSAYIGFILACLAISGDWAAQDPIVSICTPIMIFGVLIYDMVHTTIARIVSGKVRSFHEWVSYVGKDHIHHRLFRLFQGNKRTVSLILALSTCLGISAMILQHDDDTVNSLLTVTQGVIAFIMFSSVNFYQERALVRLETSRRTCRVQQRISVLVGAEKNELEYAGILMDTSEQGARVLFRAPVDIGVGSFLNIAAKAKWSDDIVEYLPKGKVVRTRSVILDNDDFVEEYVECGIQFTDAKRQDVFKLLARVDNKKMQSLSSDSYKESPVDEKDKLAA